MQRRRFHGGGNCLPRDGSRVAVVRPGVDKSWTVLMSGRYIISDILHHKGLLYGISYGSIPRLFVWDMNNISHASLQKMTMIPITMPSPPPNIYGDWFYLVEVFGELVGVRMIHEYSTGVDDDDDPWEENEDMTYYTSRVFLFKAEKGRWVEVKDLGDCCLFLGGNTSTVFSPVPSGFRRNCIYFTDNYFEGVNYGGRDMGVYSLDDGEYRPFYNGELFKTFSPPLWVTFSRSRSMINK